MSIMIDSNNTSELFINELIDISQDHSASLKLRWAYGSMPLLVLSLMSGYIIRYVLLKKLFNLKIFWNFIFSELVCMATLIKKSYDSLGILTQNKLIIFITLVFQKVKLIPEVKIKNIFVHLDVILLIFKYVDVKLLKILI